MQNITRIRHTTVKVSAVENPDDLPKPQFQEIHGTVSSVRLDAMIALAFSSSRSSMLGLIEGGKVFVNGKMVVSNGHPLKPEDIVSVVDMESSAMTEWREQQKRTVQCYRTEIYITYSQIRSCISTKIQQDVTVQ